MIRPAIDRGKFARLTRSVEMLRAEYQLLSDERADLNRGRGEQLRVLAANREHLAPLERGDGFREVRRQIAEQTLNAQQQIDLLQPIADELIAEAQADAASRSSDTTGRFPVGLNKLPIATEIELLRTLAGVEAGIAEINARMADVAERVRKTAPLAERLRKYANPIQMEGNV